MVARRPTPLTTERYLPRDAVNEISFTGCYEDSRDSVASSIDTSSLYSQRSREAVRRSRTTSDDVLKGGVALAAAARGNHGSQSHSRHASLSNEVLLAGDEVVYEEYDHSYEEDDHSYEAEEQAAAYAAGRAGPAAAFSPRAFHGSEAMGEDPGLNAEVVKLNVQQRKASATKGRGLRATWRRRMGAAL